jgi:hypothetical protein
MKGGQQLHPPTLSLPTLGEGKAVTDNRPRASFDEMDSSAT